MNNLFEIKNDLLEPLSDNQLKQKLNKKVVLKYITQMRIDHNIFITEQDFRVKLGLIYEECKDLTNEQFINNCKILINQDLFNKIPPAYKFKQSSQEKNDGLDYYRWVVSQKNGGNKNGQGK